MTEQMDENEDSQENYIDKANGDDVIVDEDDGDY